MDAAIHQDCADRVDVVAEKGDRYSRGDRVSAWARYADAGSRISLARSGSKCELLKGAPAHGWLAHPSRSCSVAHPSFSPTDRIADHSEGDSSQCSCSRVALSRLSVFPRTPTTVTGLVQRARALERRTSLSLYTPSARARACA